MWLDCLFAWPDQLPPIAQLDLCSLDAIAIQLRFQQHLDAEQRLLAASANPEAVVDRSALAFLQAYLALVRSDFTRADELIQRGEVMSSSFPADWKAFLTFQLALKRLDTQGLPLLTDPIWSQFSSWQPLLVTQAAIALARSELTECTHLLSRIPQPHSLEATRVHAALLLRQRHFQSALDLLAPAVERFPQNLELQAQFVSAAIEARSQHLTLPALRQAVKSHGEHPRLLSSVCTVKLLQRQPSLARRSGLIQRLWPNDAHTDQGRLSNVLVAYEQIGHADWLAHLSLSALRDASAQLAIQENRCLQLASVQSPLVPQQLQTVVEAYSRNPIASDWSEWASPHPPSSSPSRLRIGWLSADVCHHPVARFVMGFFEASAHQFQHDHILVNLRDHAAESYLDRFRRYPQLGHLDATALDPFEKARVIREAKLDVAIDLSGWTGGHFMRGFLARLAPLQVNYLGYFATTGLPSMDSWIGDDGLFPSPMHEWHTETVHRLSRCFIAWQPSQQLDEAHEPVTTAPSGGIRFGCFNHNRKLSDHVLRLWGELLSSIPDSSLVLKANASSDPHTQTLLVRRMRRCGLDPERVVWLPLAPSHREHLQQYAQVDVALDSFPNGGCTTTCEALWMGVPVITLTGTHYVSRMSTAVLRGAGLAEWCADSPAAYLALARQQAERLAELRANRDRWRHQVIHSPLGDAADLMGHLEQAFVSLHAMALAR